MAHTVAARRRRDVDDRTHDHRRRPAHPRRATTHGDRRPTRRRRTRQTDPRRRARPQPRVAPAAPDPAAPGRARCRHPRRLGARRRRHGHRLRHGPARLVARRTDRRVLHGHRPRNRTRRHPPPVLHPQQAGPARHVRRGVAAAALHDQPVGAPPVAPAAPRGVRQRARPSRRRGSPTASRGTSNGWSQ